MRNTLIAVAVAALLTACTTTPTTPPQLDLPAASANPVSATALERWWKAFNDPTLDALVDEALAHNLDLASAMARVAVRYLPHRSSVYDASRATR